MRKDFNKLLNKLATINNKFNNEQANQKFDVLKSLSKLPFKRTLNLVEYNALLLFIASHPDNKEIKKIVQEEFLRIRIYLKNLNKKSLSKLIDTGLPYTEIVAGFSHDFLMWLNQYHNCKVSIDSFNKSGVDLNTLLKITLPPLERDETTAGLDNNSLMNALKVKRNDRLTFLLNEFNKLESLPIVKDFLWDSLQIYLEIKGTDHKFCIAQNRIPKKNIFYQTNLLKIFDHKNLFFQTLPRPQSLTDQLLLEITRVIKISMVLTLRETDPITYMQESTLRLYELERGISVAIYGMKANRQLPLQSYIGYTLFKNGFPISYGGGWILGKTAKFGLNIFESFRGGESGFTMCQLIRVYKQVFGINYFEIESTQYGLDNPDGIKSGAFWFYYRYGFRPIDNLIYEIAEREQKKIISNPNYKTSEKILVQFTESNLALQLDNEKPIHLSEIKTKITSMIATKFKGNRKEALKFCVRELLEKIEIKSKFNSDEYHVLEDFALLVKILDIKSKKKMELLKKLIKMKPIDPYQYNNLMINFLSN